MNTLCKQKQKSRSISIRYYSMLVKRQEGKNWQSKDYLQNRFVLK